MFLLFASCILNKLSENYTDGSDARKRIRWANFAINATVVGVILASTAAVLYMEGTDRLMDILFGEITETDDGRLLERSYTFKRRESREQAMSHLDKLRQPAMRPEYARKIRESIGNKDYN